MHEDLKHGHFSKIKTSIFRFYYTLLNQIRNRLHPKWKKSDSKKNALNIRASGYYTAKT